jgi:hypothetical protein
MVCVLLVADSDGGGEGGSGKEAAALTEKRMGRSVPPVNTITYTVREGGDLGSSVRYVLTGSYFFLYACNDFLFL